MTAEQATEAPIQLPWLVPGGGALVALARGGLEPPWPALRHDPGAVLLVARHSSDLDPLAPGLLDAAHGFLRTASQPFLDWSRPEVAPLHAWACELARAAEDAARRGGRCDPLQAWTAGLLAPLGWFALAATDPENWRSHSAAVAQAIARRLARRWNLPAWLRPIVGDLGLPAEPPDRADLFLHVQGAVAQLHALAPVELPVPVVAETVERSSDHWSWHRPTHGTWVDPRNAALLPDLLAVAAERRRLSDAPDLRSLEAEVDRLHAALSEQRATEADRLHRSKLAALAELAAGAGHEINNPLAVISGQSQVMLNHETEPDRTKALQTIVRQTQRIHGILTELMQFARPPQPRRDDLDLGPLAIDVVESFRATAEAKEIHLECDRPSLPLPASIDPAQIRTALSALVRNAIEASASGGWVRVTCGTIGEEQVQVVVEDSGAGPMPAQVEHLFDPFFSGRSAGRGRGLGLSTAWRLATQHGGDVRYEPTPSRPARFVLRLPRKTFRAEPSDRKCA